MENIIDYIKNGREKVGKVLDFLSDQLELLHNGEDVDYLALLDAVNFIEAYPDSFLIPKENAIFRESTEKYNFYGFNSLINQYRAENTELKALAKSLREYVKAAMGDTVFEKKIFEEQLDTCIQRQREHMDTEVNTILPLLKLMLTTNQIKKLSKNFKSNLNSSDEANHFVITDKICHLTTEEKANTHRLN